MLVIHSALLEVHPMAMRKRWFLAVKLLENFTPYICPKYIDVTSHTRCVRFLELNP